jgi:hypothetical protein
MHGDFTIPEETPDNFDVNAPIRIHDRVSHRADRIPPRILHVMALGDGHVVCCERTSDGKLTTVKFPPSDLYRNIVYVVQIDQQFVVNVKKANGEWVEAGTYGEKDPPPPGFVPITIQQVGPNSIIWSDGVESPRIGSDVVENMPADWVAQSGIGDPGRVP